LECPSDRGLSAGATCFDDSNKSDPKASYYYADRDDAQLVTQIYSANNGRGRLSSIGAPSKKVVFYEKTLTTKPPANRPGGWHNKFQSGACAFVDQHSALMIATNNVKGTENAEFY
jgi:hypothetical protein